MTIINRFENWLAANDPAALATFTPAIDVNRLEAALAPVKSANSLLDLYRWRNGQPQGSRGLHFGYSFPTIISLFDTMKMLDEMSEVGEWDDEEKKWKSWWVIGWVPFLDNGSGDLLCIDTVGSFGGEVGQVIEFLHDSDTRTILAPSFDVWFESWVASLEANLWTVDPEVWIGPTNDDALQKFLAQRMPGYPKEKEAE